MKSLCLALLAAILAFPAVGLAQPAPVPATSTQAANAQASNWIVDPAKSHLGFSGTQTGAKFNGSFKHFNAQIAFDPAHPETGHALVTVDIASAVTGDTQRDEAIPGADWFGTKDFPKAVFEAKSFQ